MITIRLKNGNEHRLVRQLWPKAGSRTILQYVDVHDSHTYEIKLTDIDSIKADEPIETQETN